MDKLNPQKLETAIEYLDSWLQFNFDDSRMPGLQVAIQHGDRLIYSKAFGYADVASKQKLTTNHALRIASHSKTFTATAIMQLQEAGKLHLDDKVSKYLDWFKSSKDNRVADVTIRQLLNHTAGVIRDGEDSGYWQLVRDFPDAKELKEYVSSSKLFYDADEKFKYSNFGFGYLGLVVEAVSGVTYNDYVTQNIVNKLDLKSTGPDLDVKSKDILATGYGLELFNNPRKAFAHVSTNALASATGFYSTAEDTCRYFAAHFLGDKTLINDVSKRAMQHGYWEAEKDVESYGLGMIDYAKKEWVLYGHSGGFPGFITQTMFDPKKQLVVSVLANSLGVRISRINRAIIGIIDTFQQDTDSIKPKANNLQKFTGRFYSKWGPTDIVLVGKKLMAVTPRNWTEFEGCEELTTIDENTLRIGDDTSGYSSPGEFVKYTFDEKGQPKTVIYSGTSMLPWEEAQKMDWF